MLCAYGTIPHSIFSPKNGCVIISCFFPCHALRKAFRPSSVIITAPFSLVKKYSGFIILLLISVRTNRSTITLRNSSIRSSANDIRPGRSVWKNPTYGSRPTASSAPPHIPASKEYPNESIAFTLSNGGLLFLP